MTREERLAIFTAKQEVEISHRDDFGRFPRYLSYHSDVFKPVLSKWLFENGFRPAYPNGKKFAVCLSHDVDLLYNRNDKKQNLLYGLYFLLKGRATKSSYYFKSLFKSQRNPIWKLERLLEIEQKFNAKSTFYFLSLKPGERDFNYHLSEIQDLFKLVLDSNCEIGLHGGHEAFCSLDKILQEKKHLKDNTGIEFSGYRNHYLRFITPQTWQHLASANFDYDTTFGYADCTGFRNGMCYPFYPINPNSGEKIPILELPLHIMDASFANYMRMDWKKARTVIFNIIDEVKSINGVVSILWHNNYTEGEPAQLYNDLIEYAAKNEAWFPTSVELSNHWRSNGYAEAIHQRITAE